jgi:uncharacterized membrane protein YcaP (DUF421 family)
VPVLVFATTWTNRLSEYHDWTYAEKIVRTVVVYFAIVLLLRIFGKRELAQLNSFDLVVLLLLSNVVQNAIIGPDTSLFGGLLGAATLLIVNAIVVRFARRYTWLDSLFEEQHKTSIITDGEYDEHTLMRLGLRKGDVETAIRKQGASSVEEVHDASLYPGGAVVVQLNEEDENATRGDIARLERKIDQLAAARGG